MSNGSKSRNSLVSFVRNYREAARQESMKQRRKQAFQPMVDDNLEERRLMAVTSFIDNSTSTLMITSTAQENINIQMISTSEIKTSVLIEDKYMELAVRALHKAFGLETAAPTKV